MPRKPNYRFERNERDRKKAEKKALRDEKREERKLATQEDQVSDDHSTEPAVASDPQNPDNNTKDEI